MVLTRISSPLRPNPDNGWIPRVTKCCHFKQNFWIRAFYFRKQDKNYTRQKLMVKDEYQIYLRIKSPSLQCGRLTYFTRTEIDKIVFFCWEPIYIAQKTQKPKTEKIKSVAEITFTKIATELVLQLNKFKSVLISVLVVRCGRLYAVRISQPSLPCGRNLLI